MANRYLLPIFFRVYKQKFKYKEFDHRIEMQKAIYLLQDMGVPVGDYGFRWYQHGPYSQSLQDDMYYENGQHEEQVSWSKEYEEKIDLLSDLINSDERGNYSIAYWAECLASIHYLHENMLGFNAQAENVVAELEKRKTHLKDHDVNMKAYQLVEGLFS